MSDQLTNPNRRSFVLAGRSTPLHSTCTYRMSHFPSKAETTRATSHRALHIHLSSRRQRLEEILMQLRTSSLGELATKRNCTDWCTALRKL